jgi:hypothetical protein
MVILSNVLAVVGHGASFLPHLRHKKRLIVHTTRPIARNEYPSLLLSSKWLCPTTVSVHSEDSMSNHQAASRDIMTTHLQAASNPLALVRNHRSAS